MTEPAKKPSPWIYLAMLALLVGLIAVVAVPGLTGNMMATNQRCAGAALLTLATAQQDFRDNDRDADGTKAYWRKDVAGLHGLKGADGEPIRLIDEGLARADAKPVTELPPSPKKASCIGYLFATLRLADETGEPDPDRFAACAFPKEYGSSGKLTFIVSHDGQVYRKDLGPDGTIDAYPADPTAAGWTPRE